MSMALQTRHREAASAFRYGWRYAQAKVPFYVIADVLEQGEEREIDLLVYRYARGGYHRMEPNAQGLYLLAPLRLLLGKTRDRKGHYERLACFDPETGEEIGDYQAISEALSAEKAKAAAAEAQAAAAEAQAAAAEAQAAAAEAQAAAAEARAAAEAEARALSDEQLRIASEKMRELEAEIQQLRAKRTP